MLRIYLAGHTEETDYRDYVHEHYANGLEIFDPMKEVEAEIREASYQRPLTKDEKKTIVEGDKHAIAHICDLLVAYITKFTCGTIMEVEYAWDCQVPVYIIDPTGKLKDDVWLSYHTTRFFKSIDECFEFILDNLESLSLG